MASARPFGSDVIPGCRSGCNGRGLRALAAAAAGAAVVGAAAAGAAVVGAVVSAVVGGASVDDAASSGSSAALLLPHAASTTAPAPAMRKVRRSIRYQFHARGVPASSRVMTVRAAAWPCRMHAGMPRPRYPAPASARCGARAASSRSATSIRARWPGRYWGNDRGPSTHPHLSRLARTAEPRRSATTASTSASSSRSSARSSPSRPADARTIA